ncbi:MAG: hypothetical protein IJM79_08980 [Erysipelotrichaceae bacterium]|nr:hypothetical protein [Erysipelotrichaceae bacterium]
MLLSVLSVLADLVPLPVEEVAERNLVPVVGAVAAVVITALLFLLKKKK